MKNQNLEVTATGRVVDRDSQLRNTALEQAQTLKPLSAGFDFSSIRPKGAHLSSGANLFENGMLDVLDLNAMDQVVTSTPNFLGRCYKMLSDEIYKDHSNVRPAAPQAGS